MSVRPVFDSTLPTVQREACENGTADPCADFFGSGGVSFKGILDVLNPLQQIPGVSSIYRAITGDTISPGSRILGSAVYGGPVGFAMGLVNSIVENVSGKDIGAHVVASVSSGNAQVADNTDYASMPGMYRAAGDAYARTSQLA